MTITKSAGRERGQMILLAIAEVAGGTTRLCAYEDIVVRAWQKFPQEFGLRGYADKYPDSSDLHKPLYGPLKRDGYVRVQNKKFGLTPAGLAVAEQLTRPGTDDSTGRIRRDQRAEVEQLTKKSAVELVQSNRAGELLDTDLYEFYGVTVRTRPADFAGRVATVDRAIEAAVGAQDPSVDRASLSLLVATRDALKEIHGDLINELTASGDKS